MLQDLVQFLILKKKKKFYALYSVFTECHLVLVKNKVFDKKLYDIKSMKPQERILELSNSNELHIFNIDNLMNSEFKNNSIIITNSKMKKVEIVPTQLRSMINDGRIY